MIVLFRRFIWRIINMVLRPLFCDEDDGLNVVIDPKKYLEYIHNELCHKWNGDKRDEFEKLVQKCRILRSKRNIYNAGGPC